jgi:hypothetical protein
MHEANLMDTQLEAKPFWHASLFNLEAINKSDLSGDELNSYMLDLFNKNQDVRVSIFQP